MHGRMLICDRFYLAGSSNLRAKTNTRALLTNRNMGYNLRIYRGVAFLGSEV